ncbi:MAG TPA: transporter [Tepidisphaeraceae bacterium]|nr:transporter [Tepidisphaeraceae bacterium]
MSRWLAGLRIARIIVVVATVLSCRSHAAAVDPHDATAAGIRDNSFLVEEAYNQEPGVVQHIFSFQLDLDGGQNRAWQATFTQEWPIFSQTHQFSYTIPVNYFESAGDSAGGIGDVELHYRLQALSETATRVALAPRFTLILPTADEDRGLGDGSVGYELALPLSKIVADRWTVHGNAGVTHRPDVQDQDLTSYFLGASAIWAPARDLNLLVEWVGQWDQVLDDDAASTHRDFVSAISPGLRYALNFENDAQLVVGLATPIGLTPDSPDWGVFVYLSFEHGFGR